jgi:RecB family endonuclease NucS
MPNMTPVTPAQTAEILALLAQGDLNRHQIAERLGVTPGQVIAVKAVSGRDKGENAETDEAIGDAIELTFSLERDLQRALRGNIAQLEPGLTIIDEGKEQTVSSGRIDITGRDRSGSTVVIELKAVPADRDAIGQLLAYIGDLMSGAEPVRGILVAPDFSPRATAAARATNNIRLVRYSFNFSFETISPGAGSLTP